MDRKGIRPGRSTGNDIVALGTISRERTCEARFYSKILALSEQALYECEGSGEIPFENFVWMLWSVKEAVYKFQKRIVPELLFSPTKIVVREWTRVCGDVAGKAVLGEDVFYFRSVVQDKFIATVVSDEEDFSGVVWGVRRIDDPGQGEQSRAVRELALRRLDILLRENRVDGGALRIEKNEIGCPVIIKGDKELEIPVSLAHHDRYVAYSFRMG